LPCADQIAIKVVLRHSVSRFFMKSVANMHLPQVAEVSLPAIAPAADETALRAKMHFATAIDPVIATVSRTLHDGHLPP
jgi:hypothetical protein